QAAARRGRLVLTERGAVDGVEEVDGERLHAQRGQRAGHVDEILVSLAHADDDARAGRQAGSLRAPDGRYAIVVRVRGADRRVVTAAGVQIVIDVVAAGGAKRARLVVAHDPQRDAQLELRQLGADGARSAAEVLDVRGARPARAGHHAVAPGAGGRSPPCRRDQVLDGVPTVALLLGGARLP